MVSACDRNVLKRGHAGANDQQRFPNRATKRSWPGLGSCRMGPAEIFPPRRSFTMTWLKERDGSRLAMASRREVFTSAGGFQIHRPQNRIEQERLAFAIAEAFLEGLEWWVGRYESGLSSSPV